MDIILGILTMSLGLGVCVLLLFSALTACSKGCSGNCNQGRTKCNCGDNNDKKIF